MRENAACLFATTEQGDILEDFDEGIWNALVECATIHADGGIAVMFKDGRVVGGTI